MSVEQVNMKSHHRANMSAGGRRFMSKRVRDKVYRCTRIMRCAAYFHTHKKKNNFFHEKSQAKFNINVLMCLTCPRTYHCPSGPCFVRGLKSAAHLIHFLLDVRDVHVPDVAANMPLPSSHLGLRLPRTSRRLPYPISIPTPP